MSKRLVWLSLLDFLAFIAAWMARSFQTTVAYHGLVQVVYWVTAFVGVVLAVYGFVVLTRSRRDQMGRSVLCILFALIPGCVGLMAILSHLGTQPV